MTVQIKNPIWLDAEHSRADCEVYVDNMGWVPYTIGENAIVDDFTRDVWTAILGSENVAEPAEPTAEELQNKARALRNDYLAQTDVYMLLDYPISEDERTRVRAYREYLRSIPQSGDDWWLNPVLSLDQWGSVKG